MGQRLIGGWGGECRRCGLGFQAGEFPTRLYVAEDCDGGLGLSGSFHAECAVPVWTFAAPEVDHVAAH